MADDAAADAALLATAVPGKPVKLQYTRAHEHQWEPYGSAMVIKIKAGVDADGNVLDWDIDLWSTPHGSGRAASRQSASARYLESRSNCRCRTMAARRTTRRPQWHPLLRVPRAQRDEALHHRDAAPCFVDPGSGPMPTSSPSNHSSTSSRAAGADPVEYRLRFLKDQRARDVLTARRRSVGPVMKRRKNRGRGIAFARYKNSAAFTAVALEVEVTRATGVSAS